MTAVTAGSRQQEFAAIAATVSPPSEWPATANPARGDQPGQETM